MTPESIPGLSLPRGLVLWTPLEELDISVEELIAELERRGEHSAPVPTELERRAA